VTADESRRASISVPLKEPRRCGPMSARDWLRRFWIAALLTGALVAPAAADTQAAFKEWLAGVRADAIAGGISAGTVDEAFKAVYVNSRVIELDSKQPESRITFVEYRERVVTPARIETGRARLAELGPLLQKIGHRYGVPPRFILALWAIESNFGEHIGSYPVITALATLGFEGRRAEFFRGELIDALRIVDEGHISAGNMLGSWAGAMGQCQFMPSSFLRFAVDEDGDGRRNIWDSTADVFGSIANYLAGQGWKADETWGRAVRLPQGFDSGLVSLEIEKPVSEWQKLGLRLPDGSELPGHHLPASVVQPDGPGTNAFIVYANYKAIMKWNRSTYFATAVGQLADSIGQE